MAGRASVQCGAGRRRACAPARLTAALPAERVSAACFQPISSR